MSRDDYLFVSGDLRGTLENHAAKMLDEIDSLDGDQLLQSTDDALADHFEDEYTVEAPVLRVDEVEVDQREAQVDVSRDRNRAIFDRSRPFHITGTQVTFHVPFDGDSNLFKLQPNSYTMNPPRGRISRSELLIEVTRTDHDGAAMKAEFDRQIQSIQKYLRSVSSQVDGHNKQVRGKALGRIRHRRQKLLADRALGSSLGFPMKQRDGARSTYTVPMTRKRIRPLPQGRRGERFEPELAIDDAVYEDVLGIIKNMALTMERSPGTFSKLKEEEIRDHFLMSLNSHYEGAATGETFNFNGKTDILIREGGKNLFVAECKFWTGPKGFTDTVDQLLGYSTWRDCKLAILVFNRNKDFTAVLEKINDALPRHPNFRRGLTYGDETCVRCKVHHRDDERREMTLTVLAFEVPSPSS